MQEVELNKSQLVRKCDSYEIYDLGKSVFAKYKNGEVVEIKRKDISYAKQFTVPVR